MHISPLTSVYTYTCVVGNKSHSNDLNWTLLLGFGETYLLSSMCIRMYVPLTHHFTGTSAMSCIDAT